MRGITREEHDPKVLWARFHTCGNPVAGIVANRIQISGPSDPLILSRRNAPAMHHELAKREHGGVLVRLLRDSLRDRVILRYRDERTGDAFVAKVPRSEALSAFRHPNSIRPSHVIA